MAFESIVLMGTHSGATARRLHGPPVHACLLAAALMVTLGCRSGNIYRGHELPGRYRAPATANAQKVDLSRLQSTAVSNETINKGDVLDVTVVTGYQRKELPTTPVRVGDDGTGSVPLIGPILLEGLTMEAAERAIASAAMERGKYLHPHVTVTMNEKRINKITVLGGGVEKPGVYDIPRSNSTLLAAIVAAGGLSDEAGTTVEIRKPARVEPTSRENVAGSPYQLTSATRPLRSGTPAIASTARSIEIDLVKATSAGDNGYPLEDGDVVMVKKDERKPIFVLGRVRKPGQYRIPIGEDITVLDAVALAGGKDPDALTNKVFVVRRVIDRADPVVVEVNLSDAKMMAAENVRLAPGDIVSVEDTMFSSLADVLLRFVKFSFGATGRAVVF